MGSFSFKYNNPGKRSPWFYIGIGRSSKADIDEAIESMQKCSFICYFTSEANIASFERTQRAPLLDASWRTVDFSGYCNTRKMVEWFLFSLKISLS